MASQSDHGNWVWVFNHSLGTHFWNLFQSKGFFKISYLHSIERKKQNSATIWYRRKFVGSLLVPIPPDESVSPRKVQHTPISHTPGNHPRISRIPVVQPVGKGFFGVCSSSVCCFTTLEFHSFSPSQNFEWRLLKMFRIRTAGSTGSATLLDPRLDEAAVTQQETLPWLWGHQQP